MKITIEVNDMKIEVTDDMFEDFIFSLPRDIQQHADGTKTLGRAHMMLGGQFKDGVKPLWERA